MTDNYISLDIGGTKTTIGIINYKNKTVLTKQTYQTIRGLKEFPIFLSRLIKDLEKECNKKNIYVNDIICCSLPGNFKSGFSIKFKKGSAKQLLKKGESFDGVNISQWLDSSSSLRYKFWTVNDGIAQAMGGIIENWDNSIQNKHILYIGPGTGLGGAYFETGTNLNQSKVYTDGHIYDVIINDNGIIAEDIISGRAIQEKHGVTSKEINQNEQLWKNYEQSIEFLGHEIVHLIEVLKSGKFKKIEEENEWPERDKQKMKKINYLILGGGLMRSGKIKTTILNTIKKRIDIPYKVINKIDDAALIGGIFLMKLSDNTK